MYSPFSKFTGGIEAILLLFLGIRLICARAVRLYVQLRVRGLLIAQPSPRVPDSGTSWPDLDCCSSSSRCLFASNLERMYRRIAERKRGSGDCIYGVIGYGVSYSDRQGNLQEVTNEHAFRQYSTRS